MEKENLILGGLWKKTSQKGTEFFSGTIKVNGEEVRISVFANNKKKSEKSPDYTILKNDYKKDGVKEYFPNAKTTEHTKDKGNAFVDDKEDSTIPF